MHLDIEKDVSEGMIKELKHSNLMKQKEVDNSHVSRDNITDEESVHNVSVLSSMTGVEDVV